MSKSSRISGSPGRAQHTFSSVPRAEIPRSSFDRSHGCKTTFDVGFLVPIFLDEALPGDTFNCKLTAFARMATPIFPILDNLYMETFFFAVPNRLVWDNWQKFNGEQIDPGDSTDYLVPQIVSPPITGYTEGSLFDYMGIPVAVPDLSSSALFVRAYSLIYNEWFRDQNLQDSLPVNRGDGPDAVADYNLVRRGKRHDYFTSCLPFPQKGPAVTLPLGTSAPVISNNISPTFRTNTTTGISFQGNGGVQATYTNNVDANAIRFDTESGLVTDLSTATAATVNQLRQAFQIQKLYERDARGGTRYIEILKSHFGVTSPDSRLQRPEYLGGGRSMVNINPVPQTAPTGAYAATPQGNVSAFGTVSLHGHGFTKSFVEHSIIIGLVCVRADLNYQQGLNRMFSRNIRWDYYWPALSHIGEQSVLNKEIFAVGSTVVGQDDLTFGYQERYAEYRYKPSIITGLFRSDAVGSLDSWHLAQDFATVPLLNATFIEENPPLDRCIAIPAEPHFIFDSHFSLRCVRPMPIYSVPGLIDHF